MRNKWMLLVILLLTATQAWAQQNAPRGKIRILVIVGGHGFEARPFYALFDAMRDVEYAKAQLPKDADLLQPGLEEQFDVLVRYDMIDGFSPKQEKALAQLLKNGIGLVSLHHNEASHQSWPEYAKIIGRTPNKTWSEGEWMRIFVVDKEHPITQGVGDFQIRDEAYAGYEVSPDVHVLLKTDHPKNNSEIAWVTQYGKSPVVYLQIGHGPEAYENPQYRTIVGNAIRWAAAQRPKRG